MVAVEPFIESVTKSATIGVRQRQRERERERKHFLNRYYSSWHRPPVAGSPVQSVRCRGLCTCCL